MYPTDIFGFIKIRRKVDAEGEDGTRVAGLGLFALLNPAQRVGKMQPTEKKAQRKRLAGNHRTPQPSTMQPTPQQAIKDRC